MYMHAYEPVYIFVYYVCIIDSYMRAQANLRVYSFNTRTRACHSCVWVIAIAIVCE